MPDHTNQLVPLPWTSRKGWNKSNYYNYFITTFVNNNNNNNNNNNYNNNNNNYEKVLQKI